MSRGLLVAVGLMLVVGATAAALTDEQGARPRTLAKLRSPVEALAQSGRHIAWFNLSRRCGRQVQILTPPRRRPVYLGSGRRGSCGLYDGPIALSSAGRVLGQGIVGHGNTEIDISLFTAALRAPQTRLVAALAIGYDAGDPDEYFYSTDLLPTAADGNAILFYALCNIQCSRVPGIYRLHGRRSRRLARVTGPVGLAVSGRRFAVVTNSPRCCNFTPVWSHDGRRLAWIYHGNLWTIRADGTGARQLAAGASLPSWSPDDSRIVFEQTEARGQRAVYRIDATGGGLQRLAPGRSPAWSPNATKIAFVRGVDVYIVTPDGRDETKLTTTGPATGPLSWSPDSTRIAVSEGGDIYSIRTDGAGEKRLTTSQRAEGQPAWSPDGAKIAYVDASSSSPGIAVVNADGSGTTRLTSPPYPDGSPAWSPDSSRIAYMRYSSGTELWVMGADGSSRRRLGEGWWDSPQWAPNGSTIAVGDWDTETLPSDPAIRLISPANGKTTKIAPIRSSPVTIRDDRTGRLIERFTLDGEAYAIALAPDYVALLVHHTPGVRLELYNLNGSLRNAAAVPSRVRNLAAAGHNVVFASGRLIRRLDARTGVLSTLATARGTPVGPTIEGRRVVWGENMRGAARIRSVTAP